MRLAQNTRASGATRVEYTLRTKHGLSQDELAQKVFSELPPKLTLNKLALIGKAEKSP